MFDRLHVASTGHAIHENNVIYMEEVSGDPVDLSPGVNAADMGGTLIRVSPARISSSSRAYDNIITTRDVVSMPCKDRHRIV